jgi:hypothetical protein
MNIRITRRPKKSRYTKYNTIEELTKLILERGDKNEEWGEERMDLPINRIDGIPVSEVRLEVVRFPARYIEKKVIYPEKYINRLGFYLNVFIDEDYINLEKMDYEDSIVLESHPITRNFSAKYVKACIASALTKIKDVKWVDACMGHFSVEKHHQEPRNRVFDNNIFDILKGLSNIELDCKECSVCYNPTYYNTQCKHALCLKCAVRCKEEVKNGCPICREYSFLPIYTL